MKKIHELKKYIIPAVVLTASVIFLTVSHIGCPVRFMTGIACPGCGMTRAWVSVLSLDLEKAFIYHPLFWSVPIIGILVFFRKKINPIVYNILIGIFIALFIIVYIIRMVDVNDVIVTYNIKDSVLWHVVNIIKGGIS